MTPNDGYITYQLRELQKNGLIGSVFADPENPDDFIAGYVLALGSKTLLIQAVSPYGYFDGWFAARLAAVQEAQFDAAYAERLNLLLSLHGLKRAVDGPPDTEDHVAGLLRRAMERRRAVTLWTAQETYTGFVADVNDLFVTIEPVDFMGERCQEMTFRLNDLEMTATETEEEILYEQLDDYHHAKLR